MLGDTGKQRRERLTRAVGGQQRATRALSAVIPASPSRPSAASSAETAPADPSAPRVAAAASRPVIGEIGAPMREVRPGSSDGEQRVGGDLAPR